MKYINKTIQETKTAKTDIKTKNGTVEQMEQQFQKVIKNPQVQK